MTEIVPNLWLGDSDDARVSEKYDVVHQICHFSITNLKILELVCWIRISK